MTAYLAKARLFSRDVRLYLATSVLFGFTVYGGISSVLLNLYLLRLGYGPRFIGLINATGQLAFSLFCLPAGLLGTRWSSRKLLIAGMVTIAAGFGALPLAEYVPLSRRDGWLVATFVLAWLGVALYMVHGIAYLMGATGAEERTHVFSVRTALSPLAGFAGSMMGGLLPGLLARGAGLSLDHPAPYRYPLWIAVACFVPAIGLMLSTREEHAVEGSDHRGVHRGRERRALPPAYAVSIPLGLTALIALIGFLRCAGQGAATIFFNVYLDTSLQASTATIGALTAAGQLAVVPAMLILPLATARWGRGHMIVASSLGMAAGLIPLALVAHWSAAGIGFVVVSALFSIASTSFTIYSQEIVAARWRATMAGVTNMAAGLSRAGMAATGGYVIAALGYRTFFLSGACLTATGALLFWRVFRVPRGEYARREPEG
jgi:MFS family permease